MGKVEELTNNMYRYAYFDNLELAKMRKGEHLVVV